MPTCLHFGPQVEVQKVDGLELKFEISARGFQEAPRASQEGPGASQERPKSVPRAAETPSRASKTRPSDAQDSSKTAQKQPRAQNQGSTLQNHRKMIKSIKNWQKYGMVKQKSCQKCLKVTWIAPGRNSWKRDGHVPFPGNLSKHCWQGGSSPLQ